MRHPLNALTAACMAILVFPSAGRAEAPQPPGASIMAEPLRSDYLAVSGRIAELRSAIGSAAVFPAAARNPNAATPAALTDNLPAETRGRLIETRARVAELRSAIATGSFEAAARALLGAGVESAPATPILPDVLPIDRSALRGLPPSFRDAAAGLRAAVRVASEMMGTLPDVAVEVLAAASTPVGGSHDVTSTGRFPYDTPGVAWTPQASPTLPFAVRERGTRARTAGLLLAAALDRYLPAIRSAAPSGAAGISAAPCDLADLVPYVCVSSDADHTYTENVQLLIDLGGSDTYRNTAGGAPFIEGDYQADVSLNIDLSGDDRYVTQGKDTIFAQGAGVGAVGILVDEAGDDEYTAEMGMPSEGEWSPLLIVQGGSLTGFGALFDGAGNDTYRAEVPPLIDRGFILEGQAGGQGSALVDRGVGNDRYTMLTGEMEQVKDPESSIHGRISGQGAGYLGLLSDGGGADAFNITTRLRWTPVEEPSVDYLGGHPAYVREAPMVDVQGQGAGIAAFLLTGAGDTSYVIDARANGIAGAIVRGQGYTSTGVGVLDDEGGDDTYRGIAAASYQRELTVGDDCKCSSANATVDLLLGQGNLFIGQGAGWGSGDGQPLALLEDHGGSDTYEAATEYHVSGVLHDELSNPADRPMLSVTGSNHQPELLAQGVGSDSGSGVLVDHAGVDSYTLRYIKETNAEVTTREPSGTPLSQALTPYRIGVAGQGAAWLGVGGVGGLLDADGTGDTFRASALVPAHALPDPDGAFSLAFPWPSVQGSGSINSLTEDTGVGVFVAEGTEPTIVATPSAPVCPLTSGSRGFGRWSECRSVNGDDAGHQGVDLYGFGVGSSRAVGSAPSLMFTSDTPNEVQAGPGRMPAVARLIGPTGQPISGARVHFELDFTAPPGDPGDEAWDSAWVTEATTDADGVASARVPLDYTDLYLELSPNLIWRVVATYDGEQGVYPAHADRRIVLRG